jgi:2-phosphoglycerate kinase
LAKKANKMRTIQGYKQQCQVISVHIMQLVGDLVRRRESAVVEGVHLNMKSIEKIMTLFPANVIPMFVFISNG